ncbi:hypothetical protein [Coleofasciculus sp. H7-2]|uniref:hypothetical protein n=1 Tax=Coleofasciculus sp. H7-2 TaxID=3351545 RepID=UPI00366E7E6A
MTDRNFVIKAIETGLLFLTESATRAAISETIKDIYSFLKQQIIRKSADSSILEMILIEYEKKPEAWKSALTEKLIEIEADQDEEIIKTSQKLIELVKAQQLTNSVKQSNVNHSGKQVNIGVNNGTTIGTQNNTYSHQASNIISERNGNVVTTYEITPYGTRRILGIQLSS